MPRINPNRVAVEAIRKHLEGIIAPTMNAHIDVEIEITLRCTLAPRFSGFSEGLVDQLL